MTIPKLHIRHSMLLIVASIYGLVALQHHEPSDVQVHRDRLQAIIKLKDDTEFSMALGAYLREFHGIDDSVAFGQWRVVLDSAMLSISPKNGLLLKNSDETTVEMREDPYGYLLDGKWSLTMPNSKPDVTIISTDDCFVLVYNGSGIVKRLPKVD